MQVSPTLVGKIVEVRFRDHCIGTDDCAPSTTFVYGKLWSIKDDYITVLCWECCGKHEPELEHCETAIILTSTIQMVRELK